MDIYGYRSLIFIIAIIGGASSHYNETYKGHIFILPADDEMQSPLELTFSDAKEWCMNNLPGSRLPRIIEDREIIFQFIQSAVLKNRLNNGQTVLVNGIQHTSRKWSWINGNDIEGIDVKTVWGDEKVKLYNYGYLWTEGEYSIQASRPTQIRNYICAYEHFSHCITRINRKCYRKKEVRVTWFQAKEDCALNNGELASFETLNDRTIKVSLQNLSLNDSRDYWIGIRRAQYHLDNNGYEIKFINWTDSHKSEISAKCLCINISTELRWIECDCDDSHPFICTSTGRGTNDSLTSAATINTKTSNQMTSSIDLPPSSTSMVVSSPTIPLTAALSTMISPTDQSPPNNTSSVISAVVSCVIIVVVIIIVVLVVIIIRKHRKRQLNSNRDETSKAKMATTTNEFPIYAQVQKPRENHSRANCSASNTTYSSVQPAAKINEESQSHHIFYAELDLQPRA